MPIATRRLFRARLALSVIASQCHLSHRERLWHSASLPVSFCRSLWYTYFAPGACALTPDQQDGAGEKPCCCCRRTCFFQTLCRQAGKTALYPECPAAKKLRTTLALPLKSLWVQKKEPAGMGELDKQMQEIVELLFVVSIILCYNSYKLKSRGKRNIE